MMHLASRTHSQTKQGDTGSSMKQTAQIIMQIKHHPCIPRHKFTLGPVCSR